MDAKITAIANRILAEYQSDQLPASLAKTVIIAKQPIPSAKWSVSNRWIMLLSSTEDARGYRQWQEVGRYVKKGAKAIYILAPITKMVTRKVVDEETGEEHEETFSVLVGFTGVPVFRYEDTEGKPLPTYDPPVRPPLFELAESWGISVRYAPAQAGYYGCFYPGRQEIELCTHDEDTFWHELTHAAHCRMAGGLKGGQDPFQERVAGLGAAILAELYGRRLYVRRNVEYALGYSEGDSLTKKLQVVLRTAEEAVKVVEYILTQAEAVAAAAGKQKVVA